MKISLVNPPQTQLKEPLSYISLGLGYLASSIIKAGFEPFEEVRIDNLANININDIKLDFADIYCISYMSVARNEVKCVVDYIREKYSGSKIILGGPHASVESIDTYEDIKPDFVIVGEAERLLPRLINEIGKGIEKNGILYAGIIEDLDSLPFPARRLFNYDNVVNMSGIHGCEKGVKSTTLIGSRGCPFDCKFCCRKHMMYSDYRYRSAENVKDELIELRKDYDISHVRFVDDCFTLIKDKVRKICDYTKELDMSFICITRADTCNFDVLKTLKYGGCTMINVGVESGSDRLLLNMNKRETIDQIKKCIVNAKKVGLETKVLLQYGLPGETEEDWNQTLKFLREAKPEHYTLSKFISLPGSEWSQIESKSEKWFYNDEDEKRNRLIDEIESILYG
jgi:anaerobic magnesium-protoporphyrin IX monomethyl ester cyclase